MLFATIDPLKKYTTAGYDVMANMIGPIPTWVNFDDKRPFSEQVQEKYPFGDVTSWDVSSSTVSDEGVYSYPGDPDLSPLMSWGRGDDRMYLYEYGIIAFVEDGVLKMGRVD